MKEIIRLMRNRERYNRREARIKLDDDYTYGLITRKEYRKQKKELRKKSFYDSCFYSITQKS